MRGANPGWVVIIPDDHHVPTASLSGLQIRNRSPEPVVALLSSSVSTELIRSLERIFHQIIISPEAPEWWNQGTDNLLLLQSLALSSFSALVVVRPGALLFWSLDESLEKGVRCPQLKKKENDWAVISVAPNPGSYSKAVNLLQKSDRIFDIPFILENIALGSTAPDFAEAIDGVAVSWSDLAYYNGLEIPLLFLELDEMHSLQLGCELEHSGFWQTTLYPEILALLKSNRETFKWSEIAKNAERELQKNWVAVVGMSCRLPGANSVDEYWELLASGRNTASVPPSNRLGKCELTKEMRGNFLKCPIDEFDGEFFEIPPGTVAITDPQAQLLLEVSWEAFEDAGLDPQKLRTAPVGVFYGSWSQEYKDMLNLDQRPDRDFAKKYAGNGFSSTASKLSFFYGFTGPNIATDTACCSSMTAVQLACENLQNGNCPLALAAGANVILQMDQQQKMLWATDGVCRSFDSEGRGYGRAEGVGVLVLKRYSDALRDGNKIHGIILGSGTSQEGLSPSFGTPTVENEVRTMRAALFSAKVRPSDVDYVEAHATGTAVGDPIEAEAIVKAYSCGTYQRTTQLLVGSAKTNIGHAESCSGIASIIKVLLAMKHETIPAHINVKMLNPKVDFSPIPGKLALESEKWERSSERRRIAGISNFGISGTDAHVILQESPEEPQPPVKKTGELPAYYILTLSAKSSLALSQLAQSYEKLLEQGSDTLADITYTANTGRAHLRPFRTAFVASTKEELVRQLKDPIFSQESHEQKRNVCFICRDAVDERDLEQYKALYFFFPAFQISMDVCNAICNETTGFSPLSLLSTSSSSSARFTWERKHWQLFNFSVSYSLYKLWESWGVKATTVLGLNFGELAGAAISGELELTQSFQLIMDGDTKIAGNKQAGISYISAKKGRASLTLEHWKEICCQRSDSGTELASTLLKEIASSHDCDVFIELNLKRKEFGGDRQKVLFLPEKGTIGVPCLFSSLATLYTAGYPVDWDGFYSHRASKRVSLPHYPFQRKSVWFKRGERTAESGTETIAPQLWTNRLHPLLGSYAPSTTDDNSFTHSFQNELSPQQQLAYLSDHMIGSEVIFPAAGHIELLLAAGAFQGGNTQGLPYTINNFQIHQPLHLASNLSKVLKTNMKLEPTSWNIVVETRTENGEWKRCASGDFSFEQAKRPTQNIEQLKCRLVAKESGASEFYKKQTDLGLPFGDEFKPLRNIYESESNDEMLAEVTIPPDAVHYVCHPLLADAMIQCFLVQGRAEQATLRVPVAISKFVCYRRLTPAECSRPSAVCYLYLNEKEKIVLLLDSDGFSIAEMTEPEFKATTVGSVLAAAGCASENLRDGELELWEEHWKPATKYQTEGSIKNSFDFTQSSRFVDLLRSLDQRNRFTAREADVFKRVERLAELFVFRAFHVLGWQPKLGESFHVSELADELHIAPNFSKAFFHFLHYFEESGVLQIEGQGETRICKVEGVPENLQIVENSIAQLSQSLASYEPTQSLIACASVIAPVLQGKVKGQQILFDSREGGVTHAEIIYNGSVLYKNAGNARSKVFFEIAAQLWHNVEKVGLGKKLRILEVGGGAGVFTSEAIALMEREGIEYIYHFTDISSHLLRKGESRFPHLNYKVLDLDRDPLEQGFPPGYFDIVVGLDVLHATKNLRKSVGHLSNLVKVGGHLLLGETNQPVKEFDVSFGILEGYWHFEDHDIRPTHCTMSTERWLDLLQESGFRGPSSRVLLASNQMCVVVGTRSNYSQQLKSANELKTWLLLHDMDENEGWVDTLTKHMSELGRDLVFHSENMDNLEGILCCFQGADNLASNNCRSVLEPLLLASKWMIEKKSVPRLVVATFGLWKECESESNPSSATLWGFVRAARMELPWLTTKLVDLDPDVELESRIESLLQEMWMGDDETEAVYRGGVRYTRRITSVTSPETKILLPIPNNSKDYTIQLPNSNLMQDLLYIPKTTETPTADQVIVEVRAVALNFRDVFSVLKPSERFKDLTTIGMDFSGVVSSVGSEVKQLKVGTPVFGLSFDKTAISGYISILAQNVCEVPVGLSFGEAATLPVAFVTVWHCLVNVAHACKGQTILIHAASGGVGLVAIQIAKHLDLNIIATAGSQRKRNFLRNLGIPHVYNSRTLEFGQKIMEITNGHGVDIVLNCLTGPGFKEASLEVCKIGGHFVEISKLDIWEKHEVEARKPGVHYEVVNLSGSEPGLLTDSLAQLSTMLLNSSLKPIPYTRFTASRIVSALKFLQNAKHIGKVVVEMPTFDMEKNGFKYRLFNERSTYLITGGKGAIGLAIAEWMVSKGAKYLVLLGRNPPKETALQLIRKLEKEAEAKVLSMEADVADYDQMKKVLEDIEGNVDLPPLRGIHHCAGVLSDATLADQDWSSFDYSLSPKVKGSYNLHLLTQQNPLEFFVVHSSLTCILGNPGQSNYTAGCLYTEALMESRVRNGLPAMSISWGQWDAGLAENLEMEVATAFTIPQGIAALETFFLENRTAGGAGYLKLKKLCSIFPSYEKTLLENISLQPAAAKRGDVVEVEQSLPELYTTTEGMEQRKELIRNVVKTKLCETLGLSPQQILENVNFTQLGLDSLLSIEFYNKLQSEVGDVDLGYIDMAQDATLETISTILQTAVDKSIN